MNFLVCGTKIDGSGFFLPLSSSHEPDMKTVKSFVKDVQTWGIVEDVQGLELIRFGLQLEEALR